MEWELAMQKDFTALLDNGTWELVACPPNNAMLAINSVLKTKLKSNHELDKYP